MKRMVMTGIAALAFAVTAGALTLSEAGAKLAEAAENSDTMASVMKELSAGDQVKFLKSVNSAIDAMPVSDAQKTAKFIAANKAALKNAADGNVKALLAEVFATSSVKSLTEINEQFAKELFNRNADAAHPVSDADMKKNAVDCLDAVKARTAASDVSAAAERNALAALMFIRASEGTPADLRKELTDGLGNAEASEWIAAALGEGEPKTYEPILGESESEGGESGAPVLSAVLSQSTVDTTTAFLGDLSTTDNETGMQANSFTDALMDPTQFALPETGLDNGSSRIPRTLDKDKKYYNGYRRGESASEAFRYP